MTRPTVTVAVPVLNEEQHIDACLDAIERQTYPPVEVLVIDGGSVDGTVARAGRHAVRLLHNPRRRQAAALNIALSEAKGDIFVRVDGHCVIAPDYVERCVEALGRTGAAMVGGAMSPVWTGWVQHGIATAMSSRIGAGPARFHRGGPGSWVDTVYLGAFPVELAKRVAGYDEEFSANEDAEFAHRLGKHGGIWLDPTVRSTYLPRSTFIALARQFFRYGMGRAATARRHPASLSPRQLAAPLLVIGLVSPWRRWVLAAYAALVGGWAARLRPAGSHVVAAAMAVPIMHVAWALGFALGLAPGRSASPERRDG